MARLVLYLYLRYCSDTCQMIITASAVLHNIAIQRKQPLPPEAASIPKIPDSKTNALRRNYDMDIAVMQEPHGLIDREQFIQRYF